VPGEKKRSPKRLAGREKGKPVLTILKVYKKKRRQVKALIRGGEGKKDFIHTGKEASDFPQRRRVESYTCNGGEKKRGGILSPKGRRCGPGEKEKRGTDAQA